MKKIIIFNITLYLNLGFCFGVNIDINQSGSYRLNGIDYTPTSSNDSIIRISASNVNLDLRGNIFLQGGAVAGLTGISIDEGMSNITINDGIFSGLTGYAIQINGNCSNIVIENVATVSCLLGGIQLNGTITNEISDCVIRSCGLSLLGSATNGVGFDLDYCNRIIISNCTINNCGNSINTFTGISMDNTFNCTLEDIEVNNCIGSTMLGMNLNNASRCVFKSCIIRDNSSSVDIMGGINLSGASSLNVFASCLVTRNIAAGRFGGFRLSPGGVQNNLVRDCTVQGNSGGSGAGSPVIAFEMAGNSADNYQNTFLNCLAQNNNAVGAGNICVGFQINDSHFGIMNNCIASANNSASDAAGGLYFVSGTGGNNWQVKGNQFIRNIGVNNANSFGARIATGLNNLFTGNIGFNNGTTAGNQLNSMPSVVTPPSPATNNLTSINAPWANIAIAQ